MSRKIKVALGQMTSQIGDVDYNIQRAVEFIGQAANEGADIICLPELFVTGYNMNILKEKIITLSRQYYEIAIEKLAKAAMDNSIYVIAPLAEINEEENLAYNTAVLFDRNGKKVGSFNKTHNFYLEKKYFTEGCEYPVFETDFGKIGILICYDVGFPEAARTLCLKGAEIIFIPAAWRKQDENAWLLNVPSRALENQLFTFGINRSGYEGDLHLFGRSMGCNPLGEVIIEMDYDTDEVGICEIDLDQVEEYRRNWGYLKDRKPKIYKL